MDKVVKMKPMEWFSYIAEKCMISWDPTVSVGIGLCSCGIYDMAKAKKHIDTLCEEILKCKNELISETKSEHHYRPGDNLIRQAFEVTI